jgi:hypothetical protein
METMISFVIAEIKQKQSLYNIFWLDQNDNSYAFYHTILYNTSDIPDEVMSEILIKSFKFVRKQEQIQLIIDLMNSRKTNQKSSLILKLLEHYRFENISQIKHQNLYYVAISNNLGYVVDWLKKNKIELISERDFNYAGAISNISEEIFQMIYFDEISIDHKLLGQNLYLKIVESFRYIRISEMAISRLDKIIKHNPIKRIETFLGVLSLDSRGANLISLKTDFYKEYPLISKLSYNYKYSNDDSYLEILHDKEFSSLLHNFFKEKTIADAAHKCFSLHSKRFVKIITNNIIKNNRINLEFIYLLYQLKLIYGDNYSDFILMLESNPIPFFMHNGDSYTVQKIPNLFWVLSRRISNAKKNMFVSSYFKSFEAAAARARVITFLLDIYSMILQNPNDVVDILQTISAKNFTIENVHDILSNELLKYQKENFDLKLIEDPIVSGLEGKVLSNGYKIKIPKDQHELIDWTVWLKNCVGVANYGSKVLNKKCILIGLVNHKKVEYVIEIINYRVEQFSGFANMLPSSEFKDKVLKDLIDLGLIH